MKQDTLWQVPAALLTIGGFFLTSMAARKLLHGNGAAVSHEPWNGSDLTGSLLWLAGAVACFIAAVHCEGGLRRWHGPMSAFVGGLILIVVGAGAAGAIFPAQAAASQSGYTQSRGVLDRATVTGMGANGSASCAEDSCSYSSRISVRLRTPVAGEAGSTVYVSADVSYTRGQSISVVVNPRTPDYSELPDRPYQTAGGVIRNGLFAMVALAFGIIGVVLGLRMQRQGYLFRQARWRMRDTRRRSWVLAIACGIGALWLTSIAISTMFAGIGHSFDSTMLNGQNILGACFWLAGAAYCFALAVRCERRARGLPLSGQVRTSLEPAHAPTSDIVGGVILTLLGIGFAFTAFHAQVDASRSDYTQAHGVLEGAWLNNGTRDGDACPGSSDVGELCFPAALPQPASGHTRTTVYVHADGAPPDIVQEVKKFPGRYSINVCVDPKDPGYAELQNFPYGNNAAAAWMEVIAGITLVLGVTGIVLGTRHRRTT